MKHHFKVWGGHYWLLLAIVPMYLAFIFGLDWARAGQNGIILFWLMVLSLLLTLVLGIIGAWYYNDYRDRWYLKNQDRISELPILGTGPIKTAGRHAWRKKK